jgi:hypothetical protein
MQIEQLTKRELIATQLLSGILSGLDVKVLISYLQSVNNAGGAYNFGREVDLSIQATDMLIKKLSIKPE